MIPKINSAYDQLRSFQVGGQVEETTAEQDPTKLIYILYSFLASGKQPKSGEPDDILALLQENEAQTDTFEKEFEAKSPEELQQDKKFMEFYAKFQPEQDQAAYLAKGSKIKQLRTIKKAAPIKGKETSTKAAGGNVGTYPGVSLNGPTITAKAKVKPVYTTGQVTLTKTVPNKSVDIGVRSANSHQEKTTATQRVLTKAKGAKLVKKGGKKKCSCGCEMVLSKAAGGKVIETCACKCGGKMKKKSIEKKQDGGKTTDSTNFYNKKQMAATEKLNNYNELTKKTKVGNYEYAKSIADESMKAGTDMLRQYNKGKSGYDKNGFPLKKKK